jgi:probable rRNA maturation factor
MILNRQRRIALAIPPLSEFLESVRGELRFPENAVAVQFISDVAMARLNRIYRGKSGPTDVLSFPASGAHGRGRSSRSGASLVSEAGEHGYVGDIAIAPETARRNARRYSRTLRQELRILLLHGMIHLAGYDHETDNGQMERLEQKLRVRLGLSSLVRSSRRRLAETGNKL